MKIYYNFILVTFVVISLAKADPATNIVDLQNQCDSGSFNQCGDLSKLKFDAGKIEDAQKYGTIACNGGEMRGCNVLGLIKKSQGNRKEAENFFEQSCKNKNNKGCLNIAIMEYEIGNKEKAEKITKQICETKDFLACSRLGKLEKELGKKKEANTYYSMACEGGELDACVDLCVLEASDDRISKAIVFCKKACDGGNTIGCDNLSKLESNGKKEDEASCKTDDKKCLKLNKSELLKAIEEEPICDDERVTRAMQKSFIDEEVVIAALKSGCISLFRHPQKLEDKESRIVNQDGVQVGVHKGKLLVGESKTFPEMMEWIEKNNRKSAISAVKAFLKYVESYILPEAKSSLEGKSKFLEDENNRLKAENGFRMAGNPLNYLDCINEIHPKNLCQETAQLSNKISRLESKYNRIANDYVKRNLTQDAYKKMKRDMCPLFLALKSSGWVNVNPQGKLSNCLGDKCPDKESSKSRDIRMQIDRYERSFNVATKGESFDYRKCLEK